MQSGHSNRSSQTSWEHSHICDKVRQLSEDWEVFKQDVRTRQQSQPASELLNIIKQSATRSRPLRGPCSSKLLFVRPLSPHALKENKNVHVLIQKCRVFQKGLARGPNKDGPTTFRSLY